MVGLSALIAKTDSFVTMELVVLAASSSTIPDFDLVTFTFIFPTKGSNLQKRFISSLNLLPTHFDDDDAIFGHQVTVHRDTFKDSEYCPLALLIVR